jgi:hypothetical protein
MNIITNNDNRFRNDLFAAIDYEVRPSGKRHTVKGKQLGPHFVFAWIFKDAWDNISAGIASADKYKFHSSEALFNNPAVWKEYAKPIHIAIGRCLAYFVANKMLPLACVNPGADNNKLYRVLG